MHAIQSIQFELSHPYPRSSGDRHHLLIRSGSRIYATALAELLERRFAPADWLIEQELDLAIQAKKLDLDVLLVAPMDWQEFGEWLPRLRKCVPGVPWLVLADPRVTGMFLSHLEDQPCSTISPNVPPEELCLAMTEMVEGQHAHPQDMLQLRFLHAVVQMRRLRNPLPSTAELQCACAVSLGLTNPEIAGVLHMSESTAKSHLHRLRQKLGWGNRGELGSLVQKILCA